MASDIWVNQRLAFQRRKSARNARGHIRTPEVRVGLQPAPKLPGDAQQAIEAVEGHDVFSADHARIVGQRTSDACNNALASSEPAAASSFKSALR